MANILKETKNYLNQSTCSSTTNDENTQKSKNNRKKTKSSTKDDKQQHIDTQNKEINQESTNQTTTSSNEKANQSVLNESPNTENDISIIESTPASKRTKIANPVEKIAITKTNEIPVTKKAITIQKPLENVMQTIPTNALLNLISSNRQQNQTIIIDNNGRLISSPLFSAISSSPQFFLPQLSQMQTQQSPLVLPNNFGGTILYHPTIHIHTNGKTLVDSNKYKKLAPKK